MTLRDTMAQNGNYPAWITLEAGGVKWANHERRDFALSVFPLDTDEHCTRLARELLVHEALHRRLYADDHE